VTTRTVSVILHGQRWPDPAWTQELRSVLAVPPGAGPASVVEVIEAREASEHAGHAMGAAAALGRSAGAATGDLLLVIEAGCAWTRRLLAELVAAPETPSRGPATTPGCRARCPRAPTCCR
jgi:hypothetical protein